jgi:N-acetylglucosaminyldiphosphoundecaprenol N-acetyl-beta-D-mannosaminyltransferase
VTDPPIPSRELLGVPVALTDYDGELARIEAMITAAETGYLCHAAASALVNARRDPAVTRALRGATLVLPDGMPVVWALRALGERIEDRVYGPDLMLTACERLLPSGGRHFLYGGHDRDATVALAASLRKRFPGIAIAGSWTPPHRPPTAAEEDEVAGLIDGAGTDIVWVGLGSPKQELWMERMRPRLGTPVMVGVGAAFDFHAGRVAQAPAWMQRRGLEWAFRLSREPRRLGPRYLRDNPAFAAAFARQWLAERRGRRT